MYMCTQYIHMLFIDVYIYMYRISYVRYMRIYMYMYKRKMATLFGANENGSMFSLVGKR